MPGEKELRANGLPQVGFSATPEGPYSWFTPSVLPTDEEFERFASEGRRFLHFINVKNEDEVANEISRRVRGTISGRLPPFVPVEKSFQLETTAQMGFRFRRAIGKIGFNLLAHRLGADEALKGTYDAVRSAILKGGADEGPPFLLDSPTPLAPPLPHKDGHVLALLYEPGIFKMAAVVGFFGQSNYLVILNSPIYLRSEFVEEWFFFDLRAKKVSKLDPTGAPRRI